MACDGKSENADSVFLDDKKFEKEIPSCEVLRDAKFYVKYGCPAGTVMELNDVCELPMFSGRQPGWGNDTLYKKAIEMPGGIERWNFYLFDFPPEALSPYYADVAIRGDRADWRVDIMLHQMPLVRPKAKEMICELDPESSYFFPVNMYDRDSGKLIDDTYEYWLPRRRFRFVEDSVFDPRERMVQPFPGPFSFPEVGWELTHNQALRDFLRTMPFWGLGYSLHEFALSPEAFSALKSRGISGLVESTATNEVERNYSQSVGHF